MDPLILSVFVFTVLLAASQLSSRGIVAVSIPTVNVEDKSYLATVSNL